MWREFERGPSKAEQAGDDVVRKVDTLAKEKERTAPERREVEPRSFFGDQPDVQGITTGQCLGATTIFGGEPAVVLQGERDVWCERFEGADDARRSGDGGREPEAKALERSERLHHALRVDQGETRRLGLLVNHEVGATNE